MVPDSNSNRSASCAQTAYPPPPFSKSPANSGSPADWANSCKQPATSKPTCTVSTGRSTTPAETTSTSPGPDPPGRIPTGFAPTHSPSASVSLQPPAGSSPATSPSARVPNASPASSRTPSRNRPRRSEAPAAQPPSRMSSHDYPADAVLRPIASRTLAVSSAVWGRVVEPALRRLAAWSWGSADQRDGHGCECRLDTAGLCTSPVPTDQR
jgi:hypothetical protein